MLHYPNITFKKTCTKYRITCDFVIAVYVCLMLYSLLSVLKTTLHTRVDNAGCYVFLLQITPFLYHSLRKGNDAISEVCSSLAIYWHRLYQIQPYFSEI